MPFIWSRSIKGYLIAAGLVIVIRLFLEIITPDIFGDTLLFTLPQIDLPSFFVGVKLGGEIKANTVVYAFQEGLRLATILVCIGGAQSLASPKISGVIITKNRRITITKPAAIK